LDKREKRKIYLENLSKKEAAKVAKAKKAAEKKAKAGAKKESKISK